MHRSAARPRTTRPFAVIASIAASALTTLLAAAFLVGVTAASASAAPSDQDKTWMVAAHQSNLTEIAAGNAAQQKATSQGVKDLGAMFVQMHTELDAKLSAGASALGVALPSTPSPAQQATLDEVGAKSGADFDTAWVTSQLAGHRDTLAATNKEIASGSDPQAIALATGARPVVQQHITDLQKLAGVPTSVGAGTGGQAAETSPELWLVVALAGAGVLLVGAGVTAARRRR